MLWKKLAARVGSIIVSAALYILALTLPETSWINENRAAYISIATFFALVIGVALWLVGNKVFENKTDYKTELEQITSTLENMNSMLNTEAIKLATIPIKPDELPILANVITQVNLGILKLPKSGNPKTREGLRRQIQSRQSQMAKGFGKMEKVERFQIGDLVSGLFDEAGFGLKDFRNRGQYKKIKNRLFQLRTLIKNPSVNLLIKDHIIKSESANTMKVFKGRVSSLKGTATSGEIVSVKDSVSFIHPILQSQIFHFERDIEEELSAIRVEINKLLAEDSK